MHRILICIAATIGAGFLSSPAVGKPVIQHQDRLEINWSTLRIRFYGQAKIKPDAANYAETVKHAWRDGLMYVKDAVRDLHVTLNEKLVRDPKRLSRDAKGAAKAIATSTFSYDTTYFADGTVKVHLENLLPKAVASTAVRFHQRESVNPGLIQFSGIVFDLDETIKPRAIYHVADENGAILFDVADMSREAYQENLMGRWFQDPTAAELVLAVGKTPLILKTTASGEGRFVVQRKDWDEAITGHRSLLRGGRIAIALP